MPYGRSRGPALRGWGDMTVAARWLWDTRTVSHTQIVKSARMTLRGGGAREGDTNLSRSLFMAEGADHRSHGERGAGDCLGGWRNGRSARVHSISRMEEAIWTGTR